MLGKRIDSAARLAATQQVEAWTRARFSLSASDVVMASEITCGLPGCPPLETVVVFWAGADQLRHNFKIFKRLIEVAEADLPPAWYKPELIDDGSGLSCC